MSLREEERIHPLIVQVECLRMSQLRWMAQALCGDRLPGLGLDLRRDGLARSDHGKAKRSHQVRPKGEMPIDL